MHILERRIIDLTQEEAIAALKVIKANLVAKRKGGDDDERGSGRIHFYLKGKYVI